MKRVTPKKVPPDPLQAFKNISCFKKIINGFKTADNDSLLDILMYQPKLIHSCMTKGFTLEDANLLKLSCKVYYNIPLVSSAWFGPEKGYSLNKISDVSVTNLKREEVSGILNDLELPHKIVPINLEMRQTIDNVESTFSFKMKKEFKYS